MPDSPRHPEGEQPVDRELLETWQLPPPAGDFADRVIARIELSAGEDAPAAEPSAPPRSGFGGYAVAFVAGVLVAAAILLLVLRPPGAEEIAVAPPAPAESAADRSGELAPDVRTTAAIGERATIVAEAGSRLSWEIAEDATRVSQSAGRVFYRVERTGAGFAVVTPQATVRVTGTSFSVAVTLADTTVITYEGEVVMERRGDRLRVAAGERGRATENSLSLVSEDAAETAGSCPETTGASAAQRGSPEPCEDHLTTFEPEQAELIRWAEACALHTDYPPLDLPPDERLEYAAELGLQGREAEELAAALEAVTKRADAHLKRLYIDLTGDAAGAESIEPLIMADRIILSADEEEMSRVRRKLSRERAGLERPPADLSSVSPYEEFTRATVRLGDDLQEELARRLGPKRAYALRKRDGGWPGYGFHMEGCPQEQKEQEQKEP